MTAPRIAFVVAVANNSVIGRDGGLPWRVSSDLKRFKAITMGKPIIMGRKTWESLPRKPLRAGRTSWSRANGLCGGGRDRREQP